MRSTKKRRSKPKHWVFQELLRCKMSTNGIFFSESSLLEIVNLISKTKQSPVGLQNFGTTTATSKFLIFLATMPSALLNFLKNLEK